MVQVSSNSKTPPRPPSHHHSSSSSSSSSFVKHVGGRIVSPRHAAMPNSLFDVDNSSSSNSRSPAACDVSDDSILKGAELIRRHIVQNSSAAYFTLLEAADPRLKAYQQEDHNLTADEDETLRLIQEEEEEVQQHEPLDRSLIEDEKLDGLIRRSSQLQEEARHVLGMDDEEKRRASGILSSKNDKWSYLFRAQSPLTMAEQRSDFSGWSSSDGASHPSDEVSSRRKHQALGQHYSDDNTVDDSLLNLSSDEDWVEPPAALLPPPPPSTDADTPVSHMGRGRSIRMKVQTYHVQRMDEMSGSSDTYDEDDDHEPVVERRPISPPYVEIDREPTAEQQPGASYIPTRWQVGRSKPKVLMNSSSNSIFNASLLKDPGYQHAQQAGQLWQTLVGRHVRFPASWWNGARSPPMGMVDDVSTDGKGCCQWVYIAWHRLNSNPLMSKLVRNRGSAGRLLLHMIVRDLATCLPVQDIAIGVFHPNARGIRREEVADPKLENCRVVWMAIRKGTDQEGVSVLDPVLTRGRCLEDVASTTPLEGHKRVTNVNIRAVYGDKPPLRTVFMLESELYERMTAAGEVSPKIPPALLLLGEFLTES